MNPTMSLLCIVDQAIVSCKAEQTRVNDHIQLYKEILQIMSSQPTAPCLDSSCAVAACASTVPAPATELSPGEKEDLELLEQALEKAFCVRTGAKQPVKEPSKQSALLKNPRNSAVPTKEGRQTPSAPPGKQTHRMTSKSRRADRKEQNKPATTSEHNAARPGSLSRQQQQTPGHCSNEKILRSSMTVGSENDSRSRCVSDRADSDQVAHWRSLRRKANRLWDKVAALPVEPVPGKSHFMERMRATFPVDWPRGSPEQTRALLDKLTGQGCDLAQSYKTEELLDKQTTEATAKLGGKLHEKLQMTSAEMQKSVSQVKQEWDAWDRWRPEGGCLCPSGAGEWWGGGRSAPLPPTVTHTTEAELREVETLRTEVALLQQDLLLEQALSNLLSPQLSSVVAGGGRPDVSVLRDVYSLLGEGGQRSPAVVLDSEAENL